MPLEPLPAPFFRALMLVLGAIIGSFLNVVVARLPAGESLVHPRSRCPNCKTMIPWYLNIPILSWLALRGKCATCKTPISVRYPVVEALTAVLFLAIGEKFGWSLETLAGVIMAGSLVAITFIDIDIWEIPDEISLPGIVIGAVMRPLFAPVPWWDGLAGAAIGAFLLWFVRWAFFRVRKMEGIGLGDVKLIAMIGAFVGPFGLLPVILIASAVGAVVGVAMLALNKSLGTRPPEKEPPPAATPAPADAPTTPAADAPRDAPPEGEPSWIPPPNAVPFGPFLALGGLAQFLFAPALMRIFMGVHL